MSNGVSVEKWLQRSISLAGRGGDCGWQSCVCQDRRGCALGTESMIPWEWEKRR